MTIKAITNNQIRALSTEAAQAGDYVMVAICDLALTGSFHGDDWTTLSRAETQRLSKMTPDQAAEACAEAIADAAAQASRLSTSYADEDGNAIDLTGDSLESIAAELPEDYSGPRLTVRDPAGFVRGWIGGRNDWRAQ